MNQQLEELRIVINQVREYILNLKHQYPTEHSRLMKLLEDI